MDHIDTAVLGLIIGALGVVVAVVFGLIAWRQARRKRPELDLTSALEKVSTGIELPQLEIFWEGSRVVDPYILRLSVSNSGGADLTSDMYDQNRPISAIISGGRLIAQLADEVEAWATDSINRNRFTVDYGPELIRVGATESIRLLVSGEPKVEWFQHFANITVKVQTEHEALLEYANRHRAMRRGRRVVITVGMTILGAFLFIGIGTVVFYLTA